MAYWDNDDKALAISSIASLGSIASLLSVPALNRLGMKYKTGQETEADLIARQLLSFKGYNPDGLSSALSKITGYYNARQQRKNIIRYESIDLLQKRIEKAGKVENLSSYPYLKKMGDVVTFNASMYVENRRYRDAAQLIQKNIDNGFATAHDYILLVKAKMGLYNTEDVNEECLSLLDEAQRLAGSNPNLDICKQRILLLMRMDKQAKASHVLKEYLGLLSQYQMQGIAEEEKEWTDEEMSWAQQLLDKISRI